MVIEKGDRVKATNLINGEVYEGVITDMCIGMCKENPTLASIIIKEDKSDNMKFGHVFLYCTDLKSIELIEKKN